MSFKEDLVKARGHIIIITAVIVSLAIVLRLEKVADKQKLSSSNPIFFNPELPQNKVLSNDEIKFAKIAWKYFENNYNPETGMVNSVDNYTASTMWDTGSYILALHSAHKLNIIDSKLLNIRMNKLLDFLNKMPLFDKQLPNKSYSTKSYNMVNYRNQKSEKGIGWSSIDMGRLILSLAIIKFNYSDFDLKINNVLSRFKFDNIINKGKMFGAFIDNSDKVKYIQEGRLGYEEYASKAFSILNLDTKESEKYNDFLQYIKIYDTEIPVDTRDYNSLKAHNYVLSEPYILDLIEFGGDFYSKDFAYRVYRAQEDRYKNTNLLTAVSEDNIDQSPYFVYNTVFSDGKEWSCITDKGEDASKFKTLSTKASFGWYSIYQTDYTKTLIKRINNNYNEKRGWFSGIYEVDGKINKAITCNTNAIILESLLYKSNGKLYSLGF